MEVKERCESQLKCGCPKFSWKLCEVVPSYANLKMAKRPLEEYASLCSLLRQWPFVCTFHALARSDGDSSSSIVCTDLTEQGQLVWLHCKFTLQVQCAYARSDHVVFLSARAHLPPQLKCDRYTYIYTFVYIGTQHDYTAQLVASC